jgi:hypothetical protein
VIVCIGVPLLCIFKKVAKKTPNLCNISGIALRDTADALINVNSCSACGESVVSFVKLTA